MDVNTKTLTSHSTQRTRYAAKIQKATHSEKSGLGVEHGSRVKKIK
jgi:hypothetical protein